MRLSVKILLVLLIIVISISSKSIQAQGGYYGIQIGPGISTQKWNNSSRSSLLTINGDVYMSSYGTDETNIYYVKAGYHQRGSSIDISSLNGLLNSRLKYIFHNATLGAGVKKMLIERYNIPFYYLLGVRLEYTVATNLSEFEDRNSPYYPINYFVNKFNYGTDFGGGFIFNISREYDIFLELMVSPDFSLQYEQEPLSNVVDPYHPSQTITIPKRHIRNLSFEVTVGLRMAQ